MNVSELGEDALVHRLTRRLPAHPRLVAGPGDDCAAMRVKGRRDLQLLKTDCLVEDVHFLRSHPADRVGWKALCRTVSDIAACGGKPESALITIALPADLEVEWVDAFYRGVNRAARRFVVAIVGGETARSPAGIFVSVALTGWVKPGRLALRSGGRAGDGVYVTGRLGGSIRGHHLCFEPRLSEARWLVKTFDVHAMMDLSDGLGIDLPRLADASGVGFEIDPAALPRNRGCSVEQAVSDGEDYELLFAVARREESQLTSAWREAFPKVPLTRIGRLVRGRAHRTPLPTGFSHFSSCQSAGKTE